MKLSSETAALVGDAILLGCLVLLLLASARRWRRTASRSDACVTLALALALVQVIVISAMVALLWSADTTVRARVFHRMLPFANALAAVQVVCIILALRYWLRGIASSSTRTRPTDR